MEEASGAETTEGEIEEFPDDSEEVEEARPGRISFDDIEGMIDHILGEN